MGLSAIPIRGYQARDKLIYDVMNQPFHYAFCEFRDLESYKLPDSEVEPNWNNATDVILRVLPSEKFETAAVVRGIRFDSKSESVI